MSVWFVEAIWYFYWSRFISFVQIGIIFASLDLIRLILEVPSGAIADMFGRKKAIVGGAIFLLIGGLFIFGANGFWWLFLGGLIQNIGRALISGSLEALVYDTLKKKKLEKDYDDILSASLRLEIFIFAITVLVGGFFYEIYFRLPHFLNTLIFIPMIFFAFNLEEIKITLSHKALSFKNYFETNLQGFRQLFQKSLRPFLVPIILSSVAFYFYDWGFSKPAIAINFGYYARGQAIILAVFSLINAFIISYLPLLRAKISDYQSIRIVTLVIGGGFALAGLNLGYPGAIVMLFMEMAGNFSIALTSVIINQRIESNYRATTLSTLELVNKIPYVLFILIAGEAIEKNYTNIFHFAFGGVIVIILVWDWLARGKIAYEKNVT